MNRVPNILICPLEWGLGHAARMIPVARKLREMNNNVIIGAGEDHLALFRAELKGITCISFSGFRPVYSRYLPQYLYMLFKTPVLLFHIISEHYRLKKIIREHSIDIVISDNRFGLWSKDITSVYVTHMPVIPLPPGLRFLEFAGILLHRYIIRQYSLCFIPDLPGEINLSGRLSHGVKLPDNVIFTGIISRFISDEPSALSKLEQFRHNTVILSGPEPQRRMLKQKLSELLREKEPPTVILEGRPDKPGEITRSGNLLFYSHMAAEEMGIMIASGESVICRSGYTTIMDLISLNCSALLIPTPGQTEQEYLAEYLSGKGWFSTVRQSDLQEGISIPSGKAEWPEEMIQESRILLTRALKAMLDKHQNKS